jgi:hypothetical protein
MWGRAWVLSLVLLPEMAAADVLAFDIWPSSDPSKSLSCRMEISAGQMIAVQVLGMGMPPRHAMRWPVRRPEAAAMADAMAALIAGDLPSVDIYTSRRPPAPLIAVSWSTRVGGTPMSGLYIQSGLDLPPQLARVIDAVMPGSACQTATQ